MDKCLHAVKTNVHTPPWTIVLMDDRARTKARFLALIAQLTDEHGSERQAAIAAGCDPSYPGKLRDDPTRFVGLEQLVKTTQKLGIRRDFFDDPKAGKAPDYHAYEQERLERDADQGYPEVERYIADMEAAGTPVSPEHASELREIRLARGPAAVDRERVIGWHRGMLASDARRALAAPFVPEARIETERGQRAITPIKRRR